MSPHETVEVWLPTTRSGRDVRPNPSGEGHVRATAKLLPIGTAWWSTGPREYLGLEPEAARSLEPGDLVAVPDPGGNHAPFEVDHVGEPFDARSGRTLVKVAVQAGRDKRTNWDVIAEMNAAGDEMRARARREEEVRAAAKRRREEQLEAITRPIADAAKRMPEEDRDRIAEALDGDGADRLLEDLLGRVGA